MSYLYINVLISPDFFIYFESHNPQSEFRNRLTFILSPFAFHLEPLTFHLGFEPLTSFSTIHVLLQRPYYYKPSGLLGREASNGDLTPKLSFNSAPCFLLKANRRLDPSLLLNNLKNVSFAPFAGSCT